MIKPIIDLRTGLVGHQIGVQSVHMGFNPSKRNHMVLEILWGSNAPKGLNYNDRLLLLSMNLEIYTMGIHRHKADSFAYYQSQQVWVA